MSDANWRFRRSVRGAIGLVVALAMTMLLTGLTRGSTASSSSASPSSVQVSTSRVRGSDGKFYTATNHLVRSIRTGRTPQEWLLAWAGSVAPQNPDFIAVIDATKGSPAYGKVVNTVTMGPGLQNEPHHMEYVWHKGQMIYAGGLLSDTIFVLDPSRLPRLSLRGINLPDDTPCGTVPDAFQVLKDGTAYGTEMGGPNVSGPCTYTNGQTRVGNGYGGSPGEVVHISATGKTLAEAPAATATGESPANCHDIPALPQATCANPHGIAVRQDLNRMVTSDFAEVRNYLNPDSQPVSNLFDPYLVRDTVRIWNISNENNPRVVSVSILPVGPRPEPKYPVFNENRLLMETATTNLPGHRGAFVSSMWGGAVFYTPDITNPHPVWHEIFDDTAAYRTFNPDGSITAGGDGGSWLAVSPDDKFLFHIVMGVQIGRTSGTARGMLYALNIQKLIADGNDPKCRITTIDETIHGGTAPDCPALAGVAPIEDDTSGGPHWGAMNNFVLNRSGSYQETSHITQIAVADYFVNELGSDGNHKVCLYNVPANGALSLDTTFRDEVTGEPCVDFNRADWPQGATGPARPHGVLFVAPDDRIH